GSLHEKQVKELITRYGFKVPASILVPAGKTAIAAGATETMPPPGFPGPYVVKVCSAEVLHKTESGGVMLGVTAAGLTAAVGEMQSRFPGTAILVEEMVEHSGIELIVGAFLDPELGPCVMIGAGGILAELQQDVSFRLLPCTRTDAEQMIDELVVAPVFSGYRGIGCKRESLVDAVVGIGRLVADLGSRFRELDLNPMVCTKDGLISLDAALVVDS
ncbi:MAG: acetate--CoA ligase family protein, partial [Spirochaetaceae bacterium]|nr:acetate--CoA ligase family protein [Spirochaetaceae bacterium]